MTEDRPASTEPQPGSENYQQLLARESQLTWERAQADGESPSHLIDRTAWARARREGALWWQPAIDPDLTWGRELRFVLEHARGRVLELGCGGGWLSLELARRGHEVTGLDACKPLIDAARAYARQQGFDPSRLDFRVADLNQVSLPAGEYDSVIAWHSLHHLLAVPRLMAEVRKTLRPGGCLLVCDTVLDHEERSLQRAALSLPRKAAKLALLVLARLGRLTARGRPAESVSEPPACAVDSPFEGVGAGDIERALEAEFAPMECWKSGTWFWEGLPQYAYATMSAARWQQRAALALLRLFRWMDGVLLRLGFRGNYLTGRYAPREPL